MTKRDMDKTYARLARVMKALRGKVYKVEVTSYNFDGKEESLDVILKVTKERYMNTTFYMFDDMDKAEGKFNAIMKEIHEANGELYKLVQGRKL